VARRILGQRRIGARLTASTVFGAPVERGGVTVVPVAVARFGMGAGSGSDPSKHQEGEGGGGAGSVTGSVEIPDSKPQFARIAADVRGRILGSLPFHHPRSRHES